MPTSTEEKTRALVVATRCTSVEQFVATFHRFCDDSTFFVSTLAERPVGLETAFSIQLEDKTPVLRGLCTVVEAWSTPVNRFGRPGVRLAVKRLTNESLLVFKMLQTARLAAEANPIAVARTSTPIALARTATAEAASTSPPAIPRTATTARSAVTPAAGLPSIAKPAAPLLPLTSSTRTQSGMTPTSGTPLARLPVAPPPQIPRIDPKIGEMSAVPRLDSRLDPRVSEAPSLPRYDDTGPLVSPPLSVPPAPPIAIGRAPSVNASPVRPSTPPVGLPSPHGRPAPKPTPSIIVDDELAVPAAPAAPRTITPPPKGAGPLVAAERVRAVGPRAFAPANLTAPITEVEQLPYVPEPIASDDQTNPVAVESRTPGSSFILPANPLMNLTDQSLEGFVDCALYEETGNFFRAPGYEESLVDIDAVAAPPPMTLAPVPALRHGAATAPPLSPFAFSPPPEQQFSPEQTPLPMLAPQFPPPQQRYSEPLIPYTTQPSPGVRYSAQEAMQHEHQARPTPLPRPTPMPGGQIDTSASIDSTASLLALSAKDPRRRWMVIGGSAVLGSAVLLALVLVARGGATDDTVAEALEPAAAPVGSRPPMPTNTDPPAIAPTQDVAPSAVAEPIAPVAPVDVPIVDVPIVDVPIVDPETAAAIDGPDTLPVVGSGPCKLTVATTPAGSIVKIDARIIGPSPITFAGACKRTKVDVKHPRYALGTRFVNLTADKPASIQVPLVRPTHAITIVTVPPGATISIGGNRAGTSPTSVKIMGFTGVTISVEKKGFAKIVKKVYSKVDNDRIMLKLARGK